MRKIDRNSLIPKKQKWLFKITKAQLKGGVRMKFAVLKIDDVRKYCSEESKRDLDKVVLEITTGRMEDGKNPDNHYLIVNIDEPYADEVKSIIEKHEGEKVNLQ